MDVKIEVGCQNGNEVSAVSRSCQIPKNIISAVYIAMYSKFYH